jgi:ElaB/YqjD/DUF883 family membrane-anchored ribosome-binding protein
MTKSVVDQVAKSVVDQADNYVGETVRKASQFTSTAADAVQDGLKTARQFTSTAADAVQEHLKTARNAIADGRDAVDDFVHDTSKRVKRRPIESVLLSMVIGIAVGFLVGRATSND